MKATQQGDAIDVRTERLANQAAPMGTLASQQGTAQADRVEITQVIQTAGVSSITGTANQITASASVGAVTLSLPATVSITTAFQIAGTQVVNARKTGWTEWSGNKDKGTHATYPSTTASVGYVAAELQAVMDKLTQVTEAYFALQSDLIAHGLIGT